MHHGMLCCCGNDSASFLIFMLCKRNWGNLKIARITLLHNSPFGGS